MLWSFAFAQPLLDLLGDAPEFFVARENTRGDIILLGLVATLGPPLLLLGLEALVGAVSEQARRVLHLFLVAVLVAVFALQVLKETGGTAAALIPVALALGTLASALYARSRAGPMLLTVLGPAPLVFLAVFLLLSPVSKLVLPGQEVASAEVDLPRDTPVVMIVFDELSGLALMGRDGRIDASRFPNFARLAGDATWYRNATTVADYTDTAVPALLTGELPRRGAAPIAADHPKSLFTLLGDKYSFDVTEPITDVCPRRLCPDTGDAESATKRWRDLASDLGVVELHLVLPDDLARDLPRVDRGFGDFRADATGADVLRGLGGAEADALAVVANRSERVGELEAFTRRLGRGPERGQLSFLHVELPHEPYHFLPTGQRYPSAPLIPPGQGAPDEPFTTWGDNRWLARQGFQRYLLQLRYTDRLLGEALTRLRSTGRYDRALVVVAADHGASFQPRTPSRMAVEANLPAIASVPFFVKEPGQRRGRVNDANVRVTDLLPTVAARLGIRLPWDVEGQVADRRLPAGRVLVRPRRDAEDLTLPFREFVRRRDALVRRNARLFGEGASGLYAGPDPDLLGRSVASLDARTGGGFKVDDDGLLSSVDPNGAVVPAFLIGRTNGVPSRARLAIALNGLVAAVSRPFGGRAGSHRFTAIVPPTAFVRGPNSVEVVAITGAGAGRSFTELRGSARYRLLRDGRQETLVDAAGRRIPVDPRAVQGFVEEIAVSGPVVAISGWAGTTREPRRPARQVAAFAGDRFLGSTRPRLPRPGVVKVHGRGLDKAGFELNGEDAEAAGKTVRVYAISGGRASLLPRP